MTILPQLSIIVATLNSEKNLSAVLGAIKKQTYPQLKIHVIIVDGGSTDNTIKIAESYGCDIKRNPHVLPGIAKHIGLKTAASKYVMFLDSDEELVSPRSIERKMNVLLHDSSVHAVTGSGYINPPNYSFLNAYLSDFGDPFTFFYYRPTRNYRLFVESMKQNNNRVFENEDHLVLGFDKSIGSSIFELVAMGSIVDVSYINKVHPDIKKTPGLVPHIFQFLVSKGARIGIVKNDPIYHYSTDSLSSYLRKIRSRIISNVFTESKDGFNGRSRLLSINKSKKYLYLPYAFSVLVPLLDAAYLSISRRNIRYMIHLPLTLYTAVLILYYFSAKRLGVRYSSNRYG